MKKKESTYFWTSYADLMTSMFFIMIVLFAVAIGQLQKKRTEAEEAKQVAEAEMKKIREIENAIRGIDPQYFSYNEQYKKHILKIDVQFPAYGFDIHQIPEEKRQSLKEAGKAIMRFMKQEHTHNPEIQYLLIIEGQASKDDYWRSSYENNDVLSYQRALALKDFWQSSSIEFGDECEVIVCGSGQNGAMRAMPDNKNNTANQRFLIHIMPKPGIIDTISN